MGSDVLAPARQAAEVALGSFSTGCNCAESVLAAAAAALDLGDDALARSSGYAWTGGIDESGCLCGALAAAVSLAGQVAANEGGTESQQRLRARELADEIRREFVGTWKGTCCRIVRDGREFGTPECRDNCGDVTAFTTRLTVDVLGRERDLKATGAPTIGRVMAATGTGVLLGLEMAWSQALLTDAGGFGIAATVGIAACVGLAWGALVAARADARRRLARTGRVIAAVTVTLAGLLALFSAFAPFASATAAVRVATALGVPMLATGLTALWVAVAAAWAAPAVFNLARRRGAR